ncbi:TRAP transporter small permease [Geomicrobium sp. JCM 19039]|uniref:TRAP transporter small permease n=1 Tax=Geomicrobium sp. JCM 19039 TaxID=1460636 RepID=UPI00045F28C1|nr:TRAP transporter small permease [Geomicrobium sp. JCM 19039]GAK12187.1 TRAP-type C4-dicarboxylate transport system, small permease component [Geomicrobium sp. JCM 19039]
MSVLSKFNHGITKVVEIVCMLSVIAIAMITISAFFSRYVIQQPLVGTDELALFLLVWVTFLGATLSIRNRDMISLTFVIERLSRKSYYIVQICTQAIILSFSLMGFWFGWKWLVSSSIWEATSVSLEMPLWMPMMIFPVTMLIMTLFSIESIVYTVKKLNRPEEAGDL